MGLLSSKIHLLWAVETGGRLGVGNDTRYQHQQTFNPFPFPDCTEPQRDRIRKIAEELDAHRKRVQAQHDGLTLTGMYNVLEKLRANQPLTAKEKDIHDKGLVSVLKQLHDDLDAAVFDAYGWPRTLTDAEILERLVTLNAERAREEAAGHIRWLRPEYQIPLFNKKSGAKRSAPSESASEDESTSEPELNLPASKPKKQKSKKAGENAGSEAIASTRKQPWPKSLPERAKAIESFLRGFSTPVTPAQLAACFRKPRYDNLPEIQEILETLCTFGRARHGSEKNTYSA